MSTHLGKTSFLDIPDVNGDNIVTVSGLTNLVVPGTEGITIPIGTTAQRPVSPVNGEARFNSTLAAPEIFYNAGWMPFGKIIQSVSGNIPAVTGTGNKTTTTIPLVTEGIQLWTQTFTPAVVGSSILVQYQCTASHATAGRSIFTAAFAGNTCIGMSANQLVTAATLINLTIQCVYISVSTAPITFSGRIGTLNGTNAVFANQSSAGVNYGSALSTEYRILEVI
jgi:hypothetical protein